MIHRITTTPWIGRLLFWCPKHPLPSVETTSPKRVQVDIPIWTSIVYFSFIILYGTIGLILGSSLVYFFTNVIWGTGAIFSDIRLLSNAGLLLLYGAFGLCGAWWCLAWPRFTTVSRRRKISILAASCGITILFITAVTTPDLSFMRLNTYSHVYTIPPYEAIEFPISYYNTFDGKTFSYSFLNQTDQSLTQLPVERWDYQQSVQEQFSLPENTSLVFIGDPSPAYYRLRLLNPTGVALQINATWTSVTYQVGGILDWGIGVLLPLPLLLLYPKTPSISTTHQRLTRNHQRLRKTLAILLGVSVLIAGYAQNLPLAQADMQYRAIETAASSLQLPLITSPVNLSLGAIDTYLQTTDVYALAEQYFGELTLCSIHLEIYNSDEIFYLQFGYCSPTPSSNVFWRPSSTYFHYGLSVSGSALNNNVGDIVSDSTIDLQLVVAAVETMGYASFLDALATYHNVTLNQLLNARRIGIQYEPTSPLDRDWLAPPSIHVTIVVSSWHQEHYAVILDYWPNGTLISQTFS